MGGHEAIWPSSAGTTSKAEFEAWVIGANSGPEFRGQFRIPATTASGTWASSAPMGPHIVPPPHTHMPLPSACNPCRGKAAIRTESGPKLLPRFARDLQVMRRTTLASHGIVSSSQRLPSRSTWLLDACRMGGSSSCPPGPRGEDAPLHLRQYPDPQGGGQPRPGNACGPKAKLAAC